MAELRDASKKTKHCDVSPVNDLERSTYASAALAYNKKHNYQQRALQLPWRPQDFNHLRPLVLNNLES
jgi:hypothetical protein